ncbi:MAG: GAF domain-containing protein [Anaerolineae bacterium]
MIIRLLRRLSLSQRIWGAVLLVVGVLALSLVLVLNTQNDILASFQRFVDVDTRADRMLLSAANRVATSRVNLIQYSQQTVLNISPAVEDAQEALSLLQEAEQLVGVSDQEEEVRNVARDLREYLGLINAMQAARNIGDEQQVAWLEFQAQLLAAEIGDRIETVVAESQVQMAEAGDVLRAEAQQRLLGLVGLYSGIVFIAVIAAVLIQRSIALPATDLREGAEAFGAGDLDVTIPVTGSDELALLAQTFNDMAGQLAESYRELEWRVNDRTQDLQRRSEYLQAAAEIGRTATLIFDVDELMQRSVDLVQAGFDLYYVSLFLKEPKEEWAVLKAGSGEVGIDLSAQDKRVRLGEGLVGWSIANGEARIAVDTGIDGQRPAIPELPDTRAEAALPLRSRGEIIGALSLRDDKPGTFDEDMVSILQLVADQVAVAIDNARLFAESEQSLDALRQAYGELSRKGWLHLTRTRGKLGYISEVGGGTALVGDDWQPEMVEANREGKLVQGDDGSLVVPLRTRNQVIGVVRLSKAAGDGRWNRREIALVQTLVDRLGVALESARLYQDTQRRAARERIVGEINARLRAEVEIEALLERALSELGQALDVRRASVELEVEE